MWGLLCPRNTFLVFAKFEIWVSFMENVMFGIQEKIVILNGNL